MNPFEENARSWPELPLYVPRRPATRVDNVVIFPGGFTRKLTLIERLRWRLGKRTLKRG